MVNKCVCNKIYFVTKINFSHCLINLLLNLNAAGPKEKSIDVKKSREKSKTKVVEVAKSERRSKLRNDPHLSMVDDDFVEDSLIRIAVI